MARDSKARATTGSAWLEISWFSSFTALSGDWPTIRKMASDLPGPACLISSPASPISWRRREIRAINCIPMSGQGRGWPRGSPVFTTRIAGGQPLGQLAVSGVGHGVLMDQFSDDLRGRQIPRGTDFLENPLLLGIDQYGQAGGTAFHHQSLRCMLIKW